MKYSSADFFQVQQDNITSIKIEEDDFDIQNLRKCTNLEHLEIRNTNKKNIDLSIIDNLKYIKNIGILNNKKLQEVVLPVYENKSLKRLMLINNALQSIPKNLDKLTALRHFNIERNNINEVSESIGEYSFELLDLSSNNLTSINENFYNNTYLRSLNLSNNKISTVDYKSSADYGNLKHIFLANNKINKFNLNLYNNRVISLNLSMNQLNTVPECIQEYSYLKKLTLSNNPLIKDLPNWLMEKLPLLKIIDLSSLPNLSINKTIPNLNHIEDLDLSFSELEEFPEGITTLTQLTDLKLNFNSTKKIPASIGLLINMEYLELQDNDLETIPEEIFSLPNLKEINLEYNNFSDNYISEILDKFSSNDIRCIL